MDKIPKKFLKSFHEGESGFSLIQLLIVVAILAVLVEVIIPRVSSYINVSAANAELAHVQTAARSAIKDLTGNVFSEGFLLDQAGLNVGSGDAYALEPYLTGKLRGEYWIDVTGAVVEHAGTSASGYATKSLDGDPWYLNLYFNEATDQFVDSAPAANANKCILANQPSTIP